MTRLPKDRQFMELAVKEMLKSHSEHTDKFDPLVGAVIVDSAGKELGRTHRGGLREGNHAEFTLIERKLRSTKLDGTTLYVTLEPCTQRTPPKKPCVEWIVGARIKRVVVGMVDPNPNVSGHGIRYLHRHGVQVDLFDVDLVEQIRAANNKFIEYFELAERSLPISMAFEGPDETENQLIKSATIYDLSPDEIKRYLEFRKKNFVIPSEELWEFMRRNGFLCLQSDNKYVPTLAGVVLFAKEPSDFLPQVMIQMEAQVGDRWITNEFIGPLLSFPEKLDEFLENHIRSFTEIRKFDRIKRYEYPFEALREAIFNAVVHRDYRGGQRVRISIFQDRIEIRSPGLPLQPLTIERLQSFNAPPFSRNPRVAVTFNHMTWIEEKGSGLLRMRDLMLQRGLRSPRFEQEGTYIILTFFGEEHAWRNIRVSPEILDEFEYRERQILNLLIEHGSISTSKCAKYLDVDPTTVRRHIRRLINKHDIVEPVGEGSKRRYVLKRG
jgi:ATP-dependent DNA helicase RecG